MGARLEQLRRRALRAKDEPSRVVAIDTVAAILARLEARGLVSAAERLELGRDWVRAYARDALPGHYRARDGLGVARMTAFLRAR